MADRGTFRGNSASGKHKHLQCNNTAIICERKCDVYCASLHTHALTGMSQEVAKSLLKQKISHVNKHSGFTPVCKVQTFKPKVNAKVRNTKDKEITQPASCLTS